MATKTETNVSNLKINYLTESQYETALANGEINENEIYMTPSDGESGVEYMTKENPTGTGSFSMNNRKGTVGDCSTTFGEDCEASGKYSFAKGYYSKAQEFASNSSGWGSIASGSSAHAEGHYTEATGHLGSHAEGVNTKAIGFASHAEGGGLSKNGNGWNMVSGCGTFTATLSDGSTITIEGSDGSVAYGICSHAECLQTYAQGYASHSEGFRTVSEGEASHAEGCNTIALTNQHAQGHYNNISSATAGDRAGGTTGTAFVIGNGTMDTVSNACRITYAGAVIGKSAYSTTGADYAEYFEWADGNADNEERIGYFVTFEDGRFIRKANENDYILGIVSGNPAILGNHDECWMGQNEMDEWGRFIYVTETHTDEKTGETHEYTTYKVNPNYDRTMQYIPRSERPEWSAIGMLGVLAVGDDGTCQVNGYCKVADGGIATASDTGYRVIERVTDNIVKIVFR